MKTIRIAARRDIPARADQIYALLADYQTHHPRILPADFTNYRVEEGGVGSGTIVSFDLTVGGRRRSYRQRVEEPEPGRKLTETDLATGATTTFTVTPAGDGSRVEIMTEYDAAGGVAGIVERLIAPLLLSRVYDDELTLLTTYV
jgi:hypothetical protein